MAFIAKCARLGVALGESEKTAIERMVPLLQIAEIAQTDAGFDALREAGLMVNLFGLFEELLNDGVTGSADNLQALFAEAIEVLSLFARRHQGIHYLVIACGYTPQSEFIVELLEEILSSALPSSESKAAATHLLYDLIDKRPELCDKVRQNFLTPERRVQHPFHSIWLSLKLESSTSHKTQEKLQAMFACVELSQTLTMLMLNLIQDRSDIEKVCLGMKAAPMARVLCVVFNCFAQAAKLFLEMQSLDQAANLHWAIDERGADSPIWKDAAKKADVHDIFFQKLTEVNLTEDPVLKPIFTTDFFKLLCGEPLFQRFGSQIFVALQTPHSVAVEAAVSRRRPQPQRVTIKLWSAPPGGSDEASAGPGPSGSA